jgi:hypothetical protein
MRMILGRAGLKSDPDLNQKIEPKAARFSASCLAADLLSPEGKTGEFMLMTGCHIDCRPTAIIQYL